MKPYPPRQGYEPFTAYCGVMYENILAAFPLDETKPLTVVEPFYRPFFPCFCLPSFL